jgi:hypothetical protein
VARREIIVSVNRSAHHRDARAGGCRRPTEHVHRRAARKPVTPGTTRLYLSLGEAQRGKGSLTGDWLAGVATLLAAACWGVLAALLGS